MSKSEKDKPTIALSTVNFSVAEFVRIQKGYVVPIKKGILHKSYDFCYEQNPEIKYS